MSKARALIGLLVAMVAIASLILAFYLLNPTPPDRIVMATGPAGSAYAEIAAAYRKTLAVSGIEVVLQTSGGARDNLALLSDPSSKVDVGFVTLGTPDALDASGVESLGSIFLEPLWVFTSKPELAAGDMSALPQYSISIGAPGSRTNEASRSLLRLLGQDLDEFDFREFDPRLATEKLLAGEVDVAMIVSNASSPAIRTLLSSSDISLVDFERADAYSALFPELTKLVVPAGVGSLAENLPANDKRILAFTAILAVREGLHPAVQSLLLDAASRIHSVPDIFHASASFPSATAYRIPLSKSAARYYKNGRPILHRYLPFWLAVLVMQVFVAAIPLLGIVYPMIKTMPKTFDWAMRRRIYKIYQALKAIELDVELAEPSVEDRKAALGKLDELDKRVLALRLPVTYSTMVYALKSHINVVRAKAKGG